MGSGIWGVFFFLEGFRTSSNRISRQLLDFSCLFRGTVLWLLGLTTYLPSYLSIYVLIDLSICNSSARIIRYVKENKNTMVTNSKKQKSSNHRHQRQHQHQHHQHQDSSMIPLHVIVHPACQPMVKTTVVIRINIHPSNHNCN